MKRETFQISSTAGHSVIKHAWNSSRRECQKLAEQWIDKNGNPHELFKLESESEKDGHYFVSGAMTYRSTQDPARYVTFFITKLQEAK